MKVNVEKIRSNQVTLEIEVEKEKVEEALNVSYRKVVKQINVPGFRKGKVPRPILESYLGKEALYQEALEFLLPTTYSEALEQTSIEGLGQPNVEVIQIEQGLPLIYKATVWVKPEIELPPLENIEIEEELFKEATDEDIQKVLKSYQQRVVQLVNVEDGVVEDGNIIVIDFTGYIDDVPFEGGSAENYSLEMGSGTFISGFEEQLLGMKIGEEKNIQVTFPEDYPQKDLAGKLAVFKVAVKEIKRKEYPEIDDEFAKDVSEFETLEEFKKNIAEDLNKKAKVKAQQNLRHKVVEKVIGQVDVEVPEPIIEQYLKEMTTSFAQQLGMQGATLEQYMKVTGESMDDIFAKIRPQAEKRAKINLVLEAIANAKNITVDEEDVQNRITKTSEEFNMNREDVSKSVEGVREAFEHNLLLDKVVDFLLENSRIIPVSNEK